MPYLKYRNAGRRIPRSARPKRRMRRRRPMTSGRVKRIIDAELKVRDLGIGPIEIPSTNGLISHISLIDQGDSHLTRTGNWIKPVSWMGTVTLFGNSLDVVNDTVAYRVGCVIWKENQGVNTLNLIKLMQDTSAPHQQYRIQNKGQFKILWSRTGILSTNPENPRFQAIHKFYVKPSTKILYDGAQFKNNQLFIFAFSEVDTAANPPSISFDTRLRFTDS